MSHPVTVGMLTHKRAGTFEGMLKHLQTTIEQYSGECSFIVVNNSGAESNELITGIVERSGIQNTCPTRIIDSPENNISVGRNLVMDNTETNLLLFIDDDEYPNPDWIEALVNQYDISKTMAIAGPIEPIFPDTAPDWVREIDLHNKGNLKTGDTLPRAATGNCLLDLSQVGDVRQDPADGLAGGEDAAFFQKLTSAGKVITWSEEAVVHETVSKERSTAKYMIFRFMKHGQAYKRVVLDNYKGTKYAFALIRAGVIAPIGIALALITMPFNPKLCSVWMKRGFTNLGKVVSRSKPLYGWDGSF